MLYLNSQKEGKNRTTSSSILALGVIGMRVTERDAVYLLVEN